MHIAGEGSVEKLAKAVRAGLDKVKEIRAASPQPAKSFGGGIPEKSAITAAPLTAVLGGKPQEKDGMVKFVIGRTAKMACGCEIGKEMGVNTWAAFAGTDDNAVVDGDFACLEGELQGVLKTLRAGGIHIVAIDHSHYDLGSSYVISFYTIGVVGRPLTLRPSSKPPWRGRSNNPCSHTMKSIGLCMILMLVQGCTHCDPFVSFRPLFVGLDETRLPARARVAVAEAKYDFQRARKGRTPHYAILACSDPVAGFTAYRGKATS